MKKGKLIISVRGLIMLIVLFNPLLALFLDNVAVYRYIVEPVLTILLVIECTKSRKRFNKTLIILLVTALSVLYAVLIGANKARIYLHLFCYLNAIFFFFFMVEEKNREYVYDFLKKNLNTVKLIVFFVVAVETFMLVTRRGYTDRYRWGGSFFQGTSSMPHTMSYLMLVIIGMIIIILMIEKKRIWALLSIIPFFAIFQSGARISLVLSAFLLLILFDQVLTRKQKSIALKVLAVVIVLGIGLYVFRERIFNSSLWAKIAIRSGGSYELTAGRNYIWADLINQYFHGSNFIEYFIGRGDDKTYYLNSINPLVRNDIWAHSDFLQILIGKGALGVFFYVSSMGTFFKSVVKDNKYVYKWFILLLIFVAALLNGFYSYRETTMGIPLFAVIAYYYCGEQKNKWKKNSRNYY